MTDYNQTNLKQLKQIGKDMGLLRVDLYKKRNKNELIERIKKGKQQSDYDKNVLLEQAQNEGILVNATMSKNTILQKLRNPQLTDLNENRLRRISQERGISLRGKMTKKEIINRIRNPTRYYTIGELKQIAENSNIRVDRNITKPNLIRILQNANLITTTPDTTATPINLGVSQTTTEPLELIRATKPKTAISARRDLENYKKYIKSLNVDLITARRLKTIQKTLENKKKKFEEVRRRRFTPFETRSALRNFTSLYDIGGSEDDDYSSAFGFLYDARYGIIRILRQHKQTKVKLIFKCNMIKDNIEEEIIRPFEFHSGIEINLEGNDEDELYDAMIDTIEEKTQKLESGNQGGTGWHFHSIIGLELHTVEWTPLNGSSYIELPKELKDKKAIINIKNDDNKYLIWCVLRAIYPVRNNSERVDRTLKSKLETLNTTDIEYPVSLKDINKFECLNSNISITVFRYNENDKVFPLKVSKNKNRLYKINLLLIENRGVSHYCLIKDISKLVSSQVSKHKGKTFICDNCLNSFQKEESLTKHKEYCDTNECIKIVMPKKEKSILKFKNYCHSEKVPFIIYADTESLIKPIECCEPNPQNSSTKKYQKHEPISFSYYIKCFDDNVFKPVLRSYTGEDAMQKFVESLEKDVIEIAKIPPKEMIFGEKEKERFKEETVCWICKKEFDDTADENGYKKNGKVRDHFHYTGRYRGAAHNSCNIMYRKPKFIPVVFHNLSGYDSHLSIKNLGYTPGNIDCIPNNEEKYISFTKNIEVGSYINKKKEFLPVNWKIRFIDSFKFMSTSLDKLVGNLPEEAFTNLEKYYTGDKLTLVKRKGVYPYEYMDSLERFEETKLPPKEAFYSNLKNEGISDEDYTHAQKVWDVFEMEHLQDYHNLYNETDVLLLADVFENFRNLCLEIYKLDPAHHFTAPGLAWDAALKKTEVELELLTE